MGKNNIIIALMMFVCLGTRFYLYFSSPRPYKDGDEIRITATVRSEPVRYERSQYFKLEGLKVYLPLYPEISYGDIVIVSGKVKGDKLSYPKLEDIELSKGVLYRFRHDLLEFYQKSLPSDHAALIAGVTIGSKSGISQDFWDKLKNSGTAHVVVASGMNVSLVGGFLLNFSVLFLKRKKALICALSGIWIYSIISGFDAPIVRSAIMGSIAFVAEEFGRLSASIRALTLSGIVMLFIYPGYITDVGFLLSFFATLSLVLFGGRIRKKLSKVPDIIREDLATSLAAQIGVVPLLYYFFGQLNLLSPVINTLVLWTIVPLTIIGMVGGISGLIVPVVGKTVLLLTFPLSTWFINIVRIFG